jgi:hypothetical protein
MAGKQTTAAAKKAAAAKQEATVTANAVQDKEVVNESGQTATDAAASDDSAQDKETINEAAQPVTAAGDESAQDEFAQDESTALIPLEGPVDGLWIKSVSPRGRRRAGLHFTQDATGVALCALSDDDIAAIKADPMLVVEEMTFTGDDAAEILRAAGAE